MSENFFLRAGLVHGKTSFYHSGESENWSQNLRSDKRGAVCSPKTGKIQASNFAAVNFVYVNIHFEPFISSR